MSARRVLRTLLVTALAMVVGAPAAMAADCNGLSKSSCTSREDCSYVNAYKRKDGVKVGAFCRAKPGKAKATSAQKKAKTSKSKAKSTTTKARSTVKSKKSTATSTRAADSATKTKSTVKKTRTKTRSATGKTSR